jgi:hypothetical protein
MPNRTKPHIVVAHSVSHSIPSFIFGLLARLVGEKNFMPKLMSTALSFFRIAATLRVRWVARDLLPPRTACGLQWSQFMGRGLEPMGRAG